MVLRLRGCWRISAAASEAAAHRLDARRTVRRQNIRRRHQRPNIISGSSAHEIGRALTHAARRVP